MAQALGSIIRPNPIAPTHPVAVIVPVYRGLDMTRACILAAMPGILAVPNARLVAINDASPEPGMQAMLEALAAQWPDVLTVLENPSNQGFVASVNRGLAYYPDHDAVFLNSDVIVPENWLQRLVNEAYLRDDIGTVTPFSNNATICSFPYFMQDNAPPLGLDVNAIDAAFRDGTLPCIEAPTGVGSCMYVRRACLDAIGPLNEDKFGRGYGEENDLCQRALKHGWRNSLSPNLYVHHEGGVSFSSEKQALTAKAGRVMDQLHPNYHADIHAFIAKDPLRTARLQRHIQLLATTHLPKILHVSHALGGGVAQHIDELALHFCKQAAHILLTPYENLGAVSVTLGTDAGANRLVFRIPKDYPALVDLLTAIGVNAVHIHHTAGLRPEILGLADALGVTQLLTVHDFSALGTDTTPLSQAMPGAHAAGLNLAFQELARRSDCVIFPSNATKRPFAHALGLDPAKLVVTPHIEAKGALNPQPAPFVKKLTYKIGVLGALGRGKGADRLDQIAARAKRLGLAMSFHLIGYAYKSLRAVTVSGPYPAEALPNLIQQHELDALFFPNQSPETYSYTLSRALQVGLPILAPKLGAFSERLSGRPNTLMFDPQTPADALLDQIEAFFGAMAAGKAVVAPLFEGDESRPDFYARDYLPLVSRSMRAASDGPVTVPRLDAFKVLGGANAHPKTWRDYAVLALWHVYMSPAMRWVNYLVPYSARRSIKRALSRAPMHDLIKDAA